MAEMLNKSEILQKATKEIDNIVGKDRLVQEADIPKLNYIKWLVQGKLFGFTPLHPSTFPISRTPMPSFPVTSSLKVVMSWSTEEA
ncbi:hypothetical protein CRYUN_Cryun14cG0161400 [Craigia yunnanensis]